MNLWTNNEMKLIKKYPYQIDKLVRQLPRHTIHSIRHKRHRLNIKKTSYFKEENINIDKVKRNSDIIAWFLCGEGCFTLSRYRDNRDKQYYYSSRISVTNTNLKLLKKYKNLIDDGKIYSYNPGGTRKERYDWILTSTRDCLIFLQCIYSSLPIKKEQARILIEFCKLRLKDDTTPGQKLKNNLYYSKYEALYKRMLELNRRGVRK